MVCSRAEYLRVISINEMKYLTPRNLLGLQFGSTSSFSNSAAAEPVHADIQPEADPETVGWGSTTVGTLLKAKVRIHSGFLFLWGVFKMLTMHHHLPSRRLTIPGHGSGAATMIGLLMQSGRCDTGHDTHSLPSTT